MAAGQLVGPGDAAAQAVYILDKIAASLGALGGRLQDVVRTRVYLQQRRRLAGGERRARPLLRRHPPGQHAAAGGARWWASGYQVEIEAEAELDLDGA